MTAPNFSDEEIMAYADGELDEARASELEAALAADEALGERLALFVESRARVAAACAPMLEEPVPENLMQNIHQLAQEPGGAPKGGTVLPFKPRFPIWQTAIAASIALAIGFGGGLFMGKSGGSGGQPFAIHASREIQEALSSLPSGAERSLPGGGRITLIETFRDGRNTLCREFEYQKSDAEKLVAIGCQGEDQPGWAVKFALAAPAAGTDYAPASALPALDAYLDAINATPPLAQEEEQKALADTKGAAKP